MKLKQLVSRKNEKATALSLYFSIFVQLVSIYVRCFDLLSI